MSIKIWIEIDPFRDKQKLLFFFLLHAALKFRENGWGIIDLFHTALNSSQKLFAPTLYCGDFNPFCGRAILASKKDFFPFQRTRIKTSSTLLNSIEANLHVNKTEKTRGRILYLDIFLWCLSCGERTTEHNNHIMYVTWARSKPHFPTGIIFYGAIIRD